MRLESGMYSPLGSPTRKQDRAVYASDSTWDLWAETRRRAKVLADRPSDATADDVLRAACRLLMRVQNAQAERWGIDLRPLKLASSGDQAGGEPEADFRGPPRPACY